MKLANGIGEEQSVYMGQIYANGIINIGTTAASSAKEGYFVERNTDDKDWVFVEDLESGLIYRICEKVSFDELDDDSLLHRVWVV